MNVTSNCDVTKTAHHKQMTTICNWMNPPMKIFYVRLEDPFLSFSQGPHITLIRPWW